MRELAVDLHYVERGQGNPILLIHGFPFDHTIWDRVAGSLEPHTRLILPDLRGFGLSPAPEGVYTMRLMAEDIAALMDRLEIHKAILVGHSMGGYIGLAFAQVYPDRLAGLALVSSHAGADSPERRQGRLRLAERVKRKGVKAVLEANLERFSPNAQVRELTRELILRSSGKSVIAALKGMAERPDFSELLAQLKVPCVVVAGSADAIISIEKAREMVQMLSRGWLVEVPEGGHMLMLETPDLVSAAIHDLTQRAAF
jgi:pimeloyl-ACP methyl ester carboxylesterase